MKKTLTYLLLSILIFSFTFQSFDEIVSAVKSGDSGNISKFVDNTIEITLPGKSNSYSKSQAELILHDFFASNPVKSFEVIHKSDNAGAQYCIGNLETSGGTYRTTIYMKQKNDKEVLQELRFEK